jgi:DNA/RNA endonuclease YhcR with UshA esterase domain
VVVRFADLPANPLVDAAARVEDRGNEYSIVEPQVDETGGVLLILHRETEDSLTDNAGRDILTEEGHSIIDGAEVLTTEENDISDLPIPEAP